MLLFIPPLPPAPCVAVAQPPTTQESSGSLARPAIPNAQLITLGDKNAFRSGF